MPRVMKMPPAKRSDGSPKKADWNRQWEIHQGTRPATKPGAMTRKSADPTIAAAFLITCSVSRSAGSAQSKATRMDPLGRQTRAPPQLVFRCLTA
jgi:hypothetical protein